MSNRSISMYEYRQVIMSLRLGESCRSIAKAGLIGRHKAEQIRQLAMEYGWLNSDALLPDDGVLSELLIKHNKQPHVKSPVRDYEAEIREWTEQGIQASTIHQALQRKYSFKGEYTCVRRLVKQIKDSPPSVTTVLDFSPGESAQVDFGQGPTIVDALTGKETKTWFFVLVLSWSRHQYAELVTNQTVETWVGCHRRAFEFFNGVPKKIIIDNPKCAITKACYHNPEVQRSYASCAEDYGFIISACPPREPKKKGRVEAGVKYVKKNFMPLREFRSLNDANEQLKQWVLEIAGNRKHGSTYEKPLTRFQEIEKHALKTLPAQPLELSVWKQVKVHGDCHVQYEKCRYSVPYKYVRQSLWLRSSESTIRLYQDHVMIAIHPRLMFAGARHTIDEHIPPNALAYKMQDVQWCLAQANKIGIHCSLLIEHLLQDKVIDHLRAAQGILGLKRQYGDARLEAACCRAIEFETLNYRSVKNILKAGVEYEQLPSEAAFNHLANTYTGSGKYTRDLQLLIQ
jgi:transposase